MTKIGEIMKRNISIPNPPKSIINVSLHLLDEFNSPLEFYINPISINVCRRLISPIEYQTSILIENKKDYWVIDLDTKEATHTIYTFTSKPHVVIYKFKNIIIS